MSQKIAANSIQHVDIHKLRHYMIKVFNYGKLITTVVGNGIHFTFEHNNYI